MKFYKGAKNMRERKFKVGDRVIYDPTSLSEWGTGTVKGYDNSYGFVIVEFDEPKEGLHDCYGVCKPQQGWLCIEDFLKLVAEPVGDVQEPIKDMVNHPDHYTAGGIETIDFIQAKLSPEAFEGYLAGNILKYITRYNHKNGVEDLKKAQWYLNKLVGVKDNVQEV